MATTLLRGPDLPRRRWERWPGISAAAALLVVAACGEPPSSSSDGVAGATGFAEVEICHQTGSQSNPWVLITVPESDLGAHFNHGDQYPSAGVCPTGSGGGGGGGGGFCADLGLSFADQAHCNNNQGQVILSGGGLTAAPRVILNGETCEGGAKLTEPGGEAAFSYLCWFGDTVGTQASIRVRSWWFSCGPYLVPTGCPAQ